MKRLLTSFRANQSGAVAVEFVLIAPILFGLLFGIVTLGYFMGISHSVTQLASGAARSSAAGLDANERTLLADTYLSEASERYPLLVQDGLTPIIAYQGADPAGITVTVSYAVDGTLLDIANGFLGLGITSIDGSAYLAY
ncbi:TadE/TadG family type IV pilus assembly protein [Roseovarius nanhaiticus]|uniref:TadE/TadG family type IV pilus assembly protein n=1 Tax=Roseovarius nanhaiticus TaxID=573024 RepID=UPI002492E6D8|nr:TadE/TadG family type IV pilus assembly protein [Roseovarius nanhaiticus]